MRLFTTIEFTLFIAYFYHALKSGAFKRWLVILWLLFLAYSVLDFFRARGDSFDSVPTAISAILIIACCILYLYDKLKNPDTLFLYRTPDFWIVVGLIIYFSGTFFVYIFSRNYFNNPEFERIFIIINTAFTTLRNLIFAAAILIKPEKEIFKFSLK